MPPREPLLRRYAARAYTVVYTDVADAEYEAIYTVFASRNFEAAERWLTQVEKSLARRAADHAVLQGRYFVPNDAHLYPGRNMRFVRVGAWRILYDLTDQDEDGLMDTLRVAHFRPAAQNPPMDE